MSTDKQIPLNKIDREEFLQGVDELAELCGDWKDHPSLVIALHDRDTLTVQDFADIKRHIEHCDFCQELSDCFDVPINQPLPWK